MENLAARLAKARQQAKLWHGVQTYGHRPYTFHLDEVLAVALEFEVTDPEVIVATRYHDTVEDCEGVTVELLAQSEGIRVAMLVWAVTNEEGKNRKIRGKKTYPKIAGIPGAVQLKLADRIANTRNCVLEASRQDAKKRTRSMWGMYRDEYPSFRKALRCPTVEGPTLHMWNELDRLYAWEPTVGIEKDGTVSLADFGGKIPQIIKDALAGGASGGSL